MLVCYHAGARLAATQRPTWHRARARGEKQQTPTYVDGILPQWCCPTAHRGARSAAGRGRLGSCPAWLAVARSARRRTHCAPPSPPPSPLTDNSDNNSQGEIPCPLLVLSQRGLVIILWDMMGNRSLERRHFLVG